MAQRWSLVLCLLVVGCVSTHPEQARVLAPQPAPAVATAAPAKSPAPASPAPAPQPPPPAPTAGPSAASPAHGCIVIQARNELAGLREEGKWLREHFSGWTKTSQSLLMGVGDQRFDAIDIVSATGEKRTVCFDITNFFGKF